MTDGNDVDVLFAGLARALRHAGVAVTPDRTQVFLRAAAVADAGHRDGVYWAGRATLCANRDDLETYDRVFDRWFAGAIPAGRTNHVSARRVVQADLRVGDDRGGNELVDEESLGVAASRTEVLRHRDIADLSAADKADLALMFGTLCLRPPRRRASRRRPAGRGDIDAGRMLRDELRRAGEPGRFATAAAVPARDGWSRWSTCPGRWGRTPTACSGSVTCSPAPGPPAPRCSPSVRG